MSSERKILKVSFDAWLTGMHQLVTFAELSKIVGTTGADTMCIAASRVTTTYSCPASF
jgi:hypothetical protein